MARSSSSRRKLGSKKYKSRSRKNKQKTFKEAPSTSDAIKTKSLGEIQGIPAINLSDIESGDEELGDIDGNEEEAAPVTEDSEAGWTTVRKQGKGKDPNFTGTSAANSSNNGPMMSLTEDDAREGVNYWKMAIVCYVLGANPPLDTMNGFFRRIWGKKGLDKVSMLPNGVFVVRFKTLEEKKNVLKVGHHLFDNKPLIIQPWSEELELGKGWVKTVPIWIKLLKLELKFWSLTCIQKISGLIEKYVHCDAATVDKTRLGYARVMIEVEVGQNFPEMVKFLDEKGKTVEQIIEYEWKPEVCKTCKGIGHQTDQCNRKERQKRQADKQQPPKKVRQVWRPKVVQEKNTTNSVAENSSFNTPVNQATIPPPSSSGGPVHRQLVLYQPPNVQNVEDGVTGTISYANIVRLGSAIPSGVVVNGSAGHGLVDHG